MATTDPARELSDFAERLLNAPVKRGDKKDIRTDVHLAETLGVSPWSKTFLEVISAYNDRLDLVNALVARTRIDNDQIEDARRRIEDLKRFTRPEIMAAGWMNPAGGKLLLKSESMTVLKYLSHPIRQIEEYPVINDDEKDALIADVSTLINWLEDKQLSDHDFVRAALLEGLNRFLIRLTLLQWYGWSQTMSGLREVVAAYMALERCFPNQDANTTAAAIALKTRSIIQKVWNAAGIASDVKSSAELLAFGYTLYGVATREIPKLLVGS